MDASTDPRHNQLLAALPRQQCQSWLPHLEHVTMSLAQVLYEPGETLSHVYFPTTAIVSLLYVMANDDSAEIAVVDNDGVVGVSLFMGGDSTSSRALVQSAGGAYRLTAQLMKEEFDRGSLHKHHSLDQLLCRWLLLSLDRLQGTKMVTTQALIAHMCLLSARPRVH